jgi:multicomponent Na+:H+ antiporter subunit A
VLHLIAMLFVAALVAPALVKAFGRHAFYLLALAPASVAGWALSQIPAIETGNYPAQSVVWVANLGISLDFRLDNLSWLMTVLVGAIGAIVLLYSSNYFSAKAAGLGRFGGLMLAFAGSMLGLVTADNILLLYIFWELTTVCSYLLIGHYYERKSSRRAAMQAIVITTAGGLAMLVGLLLAGETAGTYSLSEMLSQRPEPLVPVALLVLAGAVTKAALIPTHFWLPAAMAAPTPVSAYLHAAAMVKAGVYLVARFAPIFAPLPAWRWAVTVLGLGTMLLGGYRALRQYDLKLLLAFGTVSQLGFIVLLVGQGTRGAALAGLAMIGAHAVFKAGLFLSVGVVDAATSCRDLRRLSGLGRAIPVTAVGAALCVASMMGVAPLSGFVAKETAFEEFTTSPVLLVGIVLGSILTVAYGLRFWWGAFATKRTIAIAPTEEKPRLPGQPEHAVPGAAAPPAPISQPPLVMSGPVLLLGLAGLVMGLLPNLGERWLAPHANTYPTGAPGHLVLWAGFTPILLLSLAVLAIGLLLFHFRDRVSQAQERAPHVPEANFLYERSMRLLDNLAAHVTAFTQRGSLPGYLGSILVVFVVAVGVLFVIGDVKPHTVRFFEVPAQAVIGLIIVVAAVLATRARRRLKAVVLVGVTGYGVAAFFGLHGAPDVALTQVLVETVSLVVFILICRRLPAFFSERPLRSTRWVRLTIAVLAGMTMSALALIAPAARIHEPVSAVYAEGAYEFGSGKNIVNVTLVDIRAWDTMGEISVLLVAATGVASMIFISRRFGTVNRLSEVSQPERVMVWGGDLDIAAPLRRGKLEGSRPLQPDSARPIVRPTPAKIDAARIGMIGGWLRGVRTIAPMRRSLITEVTTRLLFPSIILVAVYLLFSGHNTPGGGFAAGLVVGLALTLRYLAGGRYELDEAAPVQPGVLLGIGIFLAAGSALATQLAGGAPLESWLFTVTAPVLGEINIVTSVFFDLGVFFIVVGLILDILRSQGAEIDRHIEAERRAEDDAQWASRTSGTGSKVSGPGSQLSGPGSKAGGPGRSST